MRLFLAIALLLGSVYARACDGAVDLAAAPSGPTAYPPDTTGDQPPGDGAADEPSAPASSAPEAAGQTPQDSPQVGDIDPLPGGPGAAIDLHANAHCDETGSRTAVADLSWTVAATPGAEQRVAVTKFREGFDTGSFDVSASLPADAASFTWRTVNPGGVQYWRVLTRHGNSWAPSETATFTGPTCVADYVGPNPNP